VRDAHAGLAVKSGDRIVFLGDSITRFGQAPLGWVTLVTDGFERARVKVQVKNAGIPGDTSKDMLARLAPVLALKPTWLVLSCGVNDVFMGPRGVPLDAYRANMTKIVDQAQAAGIRVMLLTPTMIGEEAARPNNRAIREYDAAVRELARTKHCVLADVGADMERELSALEAAGRTRGNLLTVSGAHLNAHGNVMMAETVLRAFGLDDAALARAKAAWLDIPGADTVGVPLTLRQLDALETRATREHTTVQRLLQPTLEKSVAEFLAR
jgi:lysophospholipase L1-like esterase